MSQPGQIPMNQKTDGVYKSQLQEFCQRSSWPLPEYTTLREGTLHEPYFKATVVVNGLLFRTSDFFKRAKDAQIEAAKVALAYFTSPPPAQVTAEKTTAETNPPAPEIKNPVPKCEEEQVQPSEKSSDTKRYKQSGELHVYKNQLQSFALKKGYSLPVYTFEREGPPHKCRFKSKVTIDGHTYESNEFFSTLKESEHAAAKVALMSLVPPESQDVALDKSIFKNLLQEFAQKSGLKLPIYNTTCSGTDHMPTFVSTVTVGGIDFVGEGAKTKKQAEMNAANVAYTCLSRSENLRPSGSAPVCLPKGISASYVKTISDLGETSQSGASSNLISSQSVTGLPKGGNQDAPKPIPCAGIGIYNVPGGNQEAPKPIPYAGIGSKDSLGSPKMETTTTSSPATHANPGDYIPLFPVEGASPQAPSEDLHGSVSDSKVFMLSATNSSPCNVVHVYPRSLNMDVPYGSVVQHCDDKWVAYGLPANQTGQ
ncbi:unnamed protein product [Rhodiola kirilowii]